MATTLLQQHARSVDPDFIAQIGAAIDRDVPDMLKATGAFADVSIAVDAEVKKGRLRAFATSCIEDRPRIVAKLARLAAGEGPIVAVDLPAAPAPTVYTVTDALAIARTRQIVRAVADIL